MRKTNDEFKKEIYDLVGSEYNFIDLYIKADTKIRVKHNKCGNVYTVSPHDFLRGRRCPYCYGNIKKTDTQFKKEVFDLVGNEYTFLDPYVNVRTKIRVKHNRCSNIYTVTPNSFLRGHRCPFCFGNIKKTNEQLKQEIYNLVGNEYDFLDVYVNDRTKLRVKHTACGRIYKVSPNKFFNGTRCPYCSITANKTNDQFKKEIYDLVGTEYVFLDSYVNAGTRLRVKHTTCGHIYEVTPSHFLNGSRCAFCNMPKEEKIITKILDDLDINYDIQKTFDDLRDDRLLSYDFYLPDQAILIEYQGQQHYEPVDHFGGTDRFKLQQKHDQMKLDYAKKHNYTLIAVPYTKDTFSEIKKYLFNHGLPN
jgi:predicted  nucleic acid-binding Zn-ribbon protein